ncbi:MAG TPA: YidB family protein [Pseudolabrys sp.]|jgi:uncharacterized protein YidB (DUF937 family)
MGLLDVLNGMQNGPRGQSAPGKGGMSPMTMAILALLAYKAIGSMGSSAQASPQARPQVNPNAVPDSGGGGLGDLGGLGGLGGMLGGLLGGGAAGSILSGGLNDLLKQFQEAGHGSTANSWVGTGANQNISPNDLSNALSGDQIKAMMQHSGLSREELLQGLSQMLPGAVDAMTPHGRVPDAAEITRRF